MMRLALVVAGGVDRSGRERVTPALLWFIGRMASRHELFVYVLRYHDRPCTYPLMGATIRDLGSPRGVGRQYAALVTALQRDGPFDIVHGYLALPSGLVASLAARRLGVPSIVTMDSGEFVALPEIGYGLQLRGRHRLAVASTVRLANRITVCSNHQAGLARLHGIAPMVIPLGVDATRFELDRSDRWIGGEAAAEDSRRRVIHVASLNRVKDQTTLLEAFAEVDDAHLDVIGEDTLGGAIQNLANRLGLSAKVTFHGFQPTDVVAGLYRRADLFVLSSRHEAANVAVLEAAVSGVATVGTHVGYLADWSPDRAITVPAGNPQALGRAMKGLLEDAPRRRRIAAAAREWALAHDADWSAAAFERLYSEVSAGALERADVGPRS